MSKVLILDLGSITHTAIFGKNSLLQKKAEGEIPEDMFIAPSGYSFFSILIGLLKRVGVDKDDTVILAGDGRNSFRKFFLPTYKGQREEFRESHELIDWAKEYADVNKVIKALDQATNFHTIWLSGSWSATDLLFTEEGKKFVNEEDVDFSKTFSLEADDIMAVVPTLTDKQCVLITKDADIDQLYVLPNVKIFTMNIKYRGGTGVYKIIDNGYKVLSHKIEKGDKGDNIIPLPDDTEKDVDIRRLVIDLINLPEWVRKPIVEAWNNLEPKEADWSKLPYPKSLARRFPQIYQKDKIITYEDSIVRELERERKKLLKKLKTVKMDKTKEKINNRLNEIKQEKKKLKEKK